MSEHHNNNDNVHGDSTHSDLLHALHSTLPRAEQAFQDNLEDQLIARLNSKQKQEDAIMKLFNEKQKRETHSRLPLTLAAAVIAIVLAGGLLFFVQDRSTPVLQDSPGCVVNDQGLPYTIQEGDTLFDIATRFEVNAAHLSDVNCLGELSFLSIGDVLYIPVSDNVDPVQTVIAVESIPPETPPDAVDSANVPQADEMSDLVPMVIATRGIELNETITEDMITVVYVSHEYMNTLQPPLSSIMNVTGSPELVIGQVANEFIREFEPVLLENLRSAEICTGDCFAVLPQNMVAVALPVHDDGVQYIPLGSRIDVFANIYGSTLAGDGLYVDSSGIDGQDWHSVSPFFSTQRVVSNAILLHVDPDWDENSYSLITLAVNPADAQVLTNIAEAQFQTLIVPHIPGTDEIGRETLVMRGFPLTDDGLAVISVPLDQVNTGEIINIGDVLDVQLSLPYQYDGSMFEVTPQPGDVYSLSSPNTLLQIADTRVLYVGRGNEDYWNPNSENQDELFMAITVNLTEAWLVQWYIENEASFSLNVDTVATNQASQQRGFALALPMANIETVPFAVTRGDIVSIEVLNLADNSNLIFENVEVLYSGDTPEQANIIQNLVYQNDNNADEGFLVIHLNFEQYYRLAGLMQADSRFRITDHQDMTPPIIDIITDNAGDIDSEQITIRNLDDEALSLQGWTLEDEKGNVYEFGETIIFSNAQHSVYTGSGQNSPLVSYWGLQDSVWQAGETVRLYDADGTLQASYTIPGN